MNDKENDIFDNSDAISDKTHPSPDKDSRFYRKFKPECTLSNPSTSYRKYRKKILSQ